MGPADLRQRLLQPRLPRGARCRRPVGDAGCRDDRASALRALAARCARAPACPCGSSGLDRPDLSTLPKNQLIRARIPYRAHSAALVEPGRARQTLGIDVQRDPALAAAVELSKGMSQEAQANPFAPPTRPNAERPDVTGVGATELVQ